MRNALLKGYGRMSPTKLCNPLLKGCARLLSKAPDCCTTPLCCKAEKRLNPKRYKALLQHSDAMYFQDHRRPDQTLESPRHPIRPSPETPFRLSGRPRSQGPIMQKALYHEKQVSALCGVHAINTLLQGPVFTEFDLAQVAQDLDALERQLMMDGGVSSEDYKKYDAEGSGNVGNDGMFSIQVLSKALETWGLTDLSN
eukprot:gene9176-16309_t